MTFQITNIASYCKICNSALFHCASNKKKSMHGQCPIGKESWCFYQQAIANGKTIIEKYTGLPNDILNIMKPVYLELWSRDLLQKCLHGKLRMQMKKESFNGTERNFCLG
ncbi:uncharacterized protein CEXT_251841 [Caerostris extrusa]|uniref:Uncharacterized protein n=1 Tax=Caerostris extrusa TaxID=172846 RepID=A0AAV4WDL8_CAEEX|nr:uncharacterized protein CEXT_251841 [Caerostris extrusa]